MSDQIFTHEQHAAAMAAAASEADTRMAAAVEAAASDAVAAERARISAITGSELFEGREAFAQKAIDKGMSAEDALDFMADMPAKKSEAAAEATQSAQEAVLSQMANSNPEIAPDSSEAAAEGTAPAMSAEDQRAEEVRAAARSLRKKQ